MQNNNKTKGLIIIVDFEKRKVFICMLKKSEASLLLLP